MRVCAACSRLLRLEGVWVRSVSFAPDRVLVTVALRRRRLVCAHCAFSTPGRENVKLTEPVWRHLDLGVGAWRSERRCAGCAAPSMRACRGRPVRPPRRPLHPRLRTWSRGLRRRPTGPRSAASSGSTGKQSGGSSSTSPVSGLSHARTSPTMPSRTPVLSDVRNTAAADEYHTTIHHRRERSWSGHRCVRVHGRQPAVRRTPRRQRDVGAPARRAAQPLRAARGGV